MYLNSQAYSWPLNNTRVGVPIPQALENPHITFDSQKTLLISLLLTGSLANNVNCGLSRVLYMYYVLYSYDKLQERECYWDNHRKRKYLYDTVFVNTVSLHHLFTRRIICLEWWTTTAADLNLQYISSKSAFSCNVITFPAFWGALPAPLVALCLGHLLFKAYNIALNTLKNKREPWEITLTFYNQFMCILW